MNDPRKKAILDFLAPSRAAQPDESILASLDPETQRLVILYKKTYPKITGQDVRDRDILYLRVHLSGTGEQKARKMQRQPRTTRLDEFKDQEVRLAICLQGDDKQE
jgi:hypothetical protein